MMVCNNISGVEDTHGRLLNAARYELKEKPHEIVATFLVRATLHLTKKNNHALPIFKHCVKPASVTHSMHPSSYLLVQGEHHVREACSLSDDEEDDLAGEAVPHVRQTRIRCVTTFRSVHRFYYQLH